MSFWDNVKKFTQPYGEDDYDDDDYEEEEEIADDYEEPVERERPARRTPRRAPAPAPMEEPEENDFDLSAAPILPTSSSSASDSGFPGKVLNLGSSVSSSLSNKQSVVLFRPNSFGDTSKAADDLRAQRAVIVNMENVDKAMARRVVDFLTGCVYALDGDVQKIAQSAYLFCPHNMDIVGNLESLQVEVESYI